MAAHRKGVERGEKKVFFYFMFEKWCCCQGVEWNMRKSDDDDTDEKRTRELNISNVQKWSEAYRYVRWWNRVLLPRPLDPLKRAMQASTWSGGFFCALKCDVGEMRMGEGEERKESVRDDMSWINKKICAECGTAENHFHHTRFMCFCNERESGWMKWAQKKENRASMVVGVRAANRHDEYKW